MNDEDKKLEAIAEQWVNMIFAQIEAKKKKPVFLKKESEEKKESILQG